MIPNEDTSRFSEYGYVVVRGVFTPKEIADWRAQFDLYPEHAGDLLSHPSLHPCVYDSRLLNIIRACGIPDVHYWLEGTHNVGGAVGFHRDNADRTDPFAPDWRDGYRIVRAGIYLQDHHDHSGGFNAKAGSHKSAMADGPVHYADTRIGDVAVWDLRILHGGYGGQHLPRENVERRALFITYGPFYDRHTDRHLQYLVTREYQYILWKQSVVSSEVEAAAKAAGLNVLRPSPELMQSPSVGKNVGWQPIPY